MEEEIELETLRKLDSNESSIDINNDDASGRIKDQDAAELHKMPELTVSKSCLRCPCQGSCTGSAVRNVPSAGLVFCCPSLSLTSV